MRQSRQKLTNLRRAASLLLEHNCGEPAPVGVFATQAAAPIAEEPLFLGTGVMMILLHLPDSSLSKPRLDIARQIDHEMAVPPDRPEARLDDVSARWNLR